jgi:exosortase/archaeosortase family protein
MNKNSPARMKISAAAIKFHKYRSAPIHRSKMPTKKTLEINEPSPRNTIFYILTALIIVLAVYYIPDYFFLEKTIADHTAFLLTAVGINVQSNVIGNSAFINEIQIVKDCTGIQVLAVFLGLLVPLPKASLKKKLLTLIILSSILYVANLVRIALEFWLVYFNVLPWALAHYPLSLLLGILGVLCLVLVTDRLLPEFGNFILYFTQKAK